MARPTIDDLLSAIRRLPLDERLRLVELVARDTSEDTPKPAPAVEPLSPLGLMADEPEVVDQMCSLVYQARTTARMRAQLPWAQWVERGPSGPIDDED
jgi:hypothetical protein